ncbi:UNVERIFIED_ORG: putative hydrolase of the HAD superfamily [Methylobacterium sp. SuP10 SLI 274]|uniref:HAD family hydrolase n=1 Tax=Methylorubrum extorquens TaxID=408 RepID=UPI00209E27CD|nr:HAD family hydrolase [Methylorubrum extorquens]MDF9864403.1 putative hydrolase of the HAD superfamily [Methylorubrum pseudosasae]MDH6637991.1 putative hydrolase of the HAD superfamily [Methylobacterium sp. SuP10 SLI 274]MDH6667174.1 putative hydrolase of the HAD superfamily [Methylorubrum zatmanii]MCP1559077.1 putative hydrolase of the HAD superfamily [Methylorubrum extorquens]MDF9792713.1 putative hydrolase of the HAD superfamily [Methylorubrum extorquens]
MIDAVLFDLDETLLDRTTSLKAFLRDQFERHADHLGQVQSDEWCARFLVLDRRGHVHKSVVYPAILDEFGGRAEHAEILLADYRACCARFAQPFDGMRAVLEELRARGLALGIVTNGETEFQLRHVRALELDKLVDAVLISEREGLRKPDATLFLRAATACRTEPSRCLFVGDNPLADVLGAHAAGMSTAWFHGVAEWPTDAPSNPGVSIDHLSQVLVLARP